MEDRHERAFEEYVGNGKPILAHHGAVASYDDWPRFGELVGVAWIWGTTNHSPIQSHTVQIAKSRHPVNAGINDFEIVDELYYDLKIANDLKTQTHATARWDGRDHPMVIAAQRETRGRLVYLANGHDLRAFEAPSLGKLWTNSVKWLLS
jgi:type 1 glutamine amidotransferase